MAAYDDFFGEPSREEQNQIDSFGLEQIEDAAEHLLEFDPEDDGLELKGGVPAFRPDHPRWRTFIERHEDGATIKWRSKLKERRLVRVVDEEKIKKYIAREVDPKTGHKEKKHLYISEGELAKYPWETLEESTICWYPDNSAMVCYLKDLIPVGLQKIAKAGLDKTVFDDPDRHETKRAIEFQAGTPDTPKPGELLFGYMNRGWIQPTVEMREQAAQYAQVGPLLQKLNSVFARTLPKHYAAQNRLIPEDFRQFGTAFSTITMLKSCPSSVHKDEGNRLGFTCMTTIGKSKGGTFCLPEYGLKIPVQPGDALLV